MRSNKFTRFEFFLKIIKKDKAINIFGFKKPFYSKKKIT